VLEVTCLQESVKHWLQTQSIREPRAAYLSMLTVYFKVGLDNKPDTSLITRRITGNMLPYQSQYVAQFALLTEKETLCEIQPRSDRMAMSNDVKPFRTFCLRVQMSTERLTRQSTRETQKTVIVIRHDPDSGHVQSCSQQETA
jgi:hypothetical protein